MAAVAARRSTTKKAATRAARKRAPLKAVPAAEEKPKARKRTYSFPRVITQDGSTSKRAYDVKITPEMAEGWIEMEGLNRPITDGLVAKYAELMGRNLWPNTGDTYKFTDEGEFIDGRHRARALLLAAKLYGVEYIYGDIALDLDPAIKTLVNSGKPTTAAQALAMEGVDYYSMTAAVIKIEAQIAAGSSSGYRRNLANVDVVEAARKDPAEYRIASHLATATRKRFAPCHPSAVAYVYKRLRAISKKHADAFFELWSGDAGGQIFGALDNRLKDIAIDRTRIDRIAYVGMLIRAWNAWNEDKPVGKFPLWVRGKSVKLPEPTTKLRKVLSA